MGRKGRIIGGGGDRREPRERDKIEPMKLK